MIVKRDSSIFIKFTGIAGLELCVWRNPAVKTNIACASNRKALSLLIGRRDGYRGVRRMYLQKHGWQIPVYIRGTSAGIIINGEHSNGVVNRIRGVLGHADYIAQYIGDISVHRPPLYIIDVLSFR